MNKSELIKKLSSAELFLRNRADAVPFPIDEDETEIIYSISELINEAIDVMERAIVPPCKVGDTVYRILPQKPSLGISEYVVKGFHYGNFIDGLGHKRKNYLIVKHRTSCLLHHIPFDAIGKTVFFDEDKAKELLLG